MRICFFSMKKFRKDREGWETIRKGLYNRCMDPDSDIPKFQKQLVYYNSSGLYETPKVYDKDGYAYNDGSWKKFSTGCMYKTGYRGMMICRDKKSVIDCLYAYVCFLRKIGVDDSSVLRYFMVAYIIGKLDFKDGMFPGNRNNTDILSKMADEVMDKDVNDICCDCDDERQYAISPDLLRCKDRGDKVKIQRKKDKELDWKRIEELYDSSKTDVQNLMEFKKKGLDISGSTLTRWKKSRKQV